MAKLPRTKTFLTDDGYKLKWDKTMGVWMTEGGDEYEAHPETLQPVVEMLQPSDKSPDDSYEPLLGAFLDNHGKEVEVVSDPTGNTSETVHSFLHGKPTLDKVIALVADVYQQAAHADEMNAMIGELPELADEDHTDAKARQLCHKYGYTLDQVLTAMHHQDKPIYLSAEDAAPSTAPDYAYGDHITAETRLSGKR